MSSKLVTRWVVVTLVASIAAALDGGWIASWAALAPAKIWHGEVWRLVTWPFVETGALGLVLTCAAIYKFGGDLAERWGDRRLFRFARHVVLSAAVVTAIAGAIPGLGYVHRLGGWAICDALVIAWARQFPDRTLTLYGLIAVRGRELVGITVGIAVLFAIFHGPVATAPELVACAAAALYPQSWLRR
jgi:membrane associated rhomboid family serine protease